MYYHCFVSPQQSLAKYDRAFPTVAPVAEEPPAKQETQEVRSLEWEDTQRRKWQPLQIFFT